MLKPNHQPAVVGALAGVPRASLMKVSQPRGPVLPGSEPAEQDGSQVYVILV
jgi:hypothetical protein